MKILVTGSQGFVGKNLVETLKAIRDNKCKIYDINVEDIYTYDIDNTIDELREYTKNCDAVVHLAGVNRPKNVSEFYEGNSGFSETLCKCLKDNGNKCPIIVSSSIQANRGNDYGKSKKMGEDYLLGFGNRHGNSIYIYRLANLFGKWCKPNYNSVVATFCYNIANDLPLMINGKDTIVPLCYIDDVIEEIINALRGYPTMKIDGYYAVELIYQVTLGKLSSLLISFQNSRNDLSIADQSDDFTRKLYATYLSYLSE